MDKQSAVNMILALTPNITQVTLLWLNKSLVYQPGLKKMVKAVAADITTDWYQWMDAEKDMNME